MTAVDRDGLRKTGEMVGRLNVVDRRGEFLNGDILAGVLSLTVLKLLGSSLVSPKIGENTARNEDKMCQESIKEHAVRVFLEYTSSDILL